MPDGTVADPSGQQGTRATVRLSDCALIDIGLLPIAEQYVRAGLSGGDLKIVLAGSPVASVSVEGALFSQALKRARATILKKELSSVSCENHPELRTETEVTWWYRVCLDAQRPCESAAGKIACMREALEQAKTTLDAKRLDDVERRIAGSKLVAWARENIDVSWRFPVGVNTTCFNAVDFIVPCTSPAARSRDDEWTYTGSVTVQNRSDRQLSCRPAFQVNATWLESPPAQLALGRRRTTFNATTTHSTPVEASTHGHLECVIQPDQAATIVSMPVSRVQELFGGAPRLIHYMRGDEWLAWTTSEAVQ